jgi:cell surface protein SprA
VRKAASPLFAEIRHGGILASQRPLFQFGALIAGAVAITLALVGTASGLDPDRMAAVVADTQLTRQRVSIQRSSTHFADTLHADTLAADSVLADSIARRAERWHPVGESVRSPHRRAPGRLVRLEHARRLLGARVQLDSLSERYIAREFVAGQDVRYPLSMDLETYRLYRYREDVDDNWRTLRAQRARLRSQQRRGGLGFNIVVPGGQQSAFTTIFGRPEVDLRVNGQAMINAGFDYRRSDQQVAFTGSPSQLDPQFKQDLRLGIVGTIGDKLRVDVNWDTNNQFDYQNQLKLQYTGYEDDIIQRIEAGNVMLQTPSRLIRGGQSLFGIKSEFQLGNLYLTTVASQQEGQTSSLSIDGGAETTTFDLKATDYEESTHFFLGYYFLNNYERALSQPPNLLVFDGFDRIESVEVWKLQGYLNPEDENVRQVVAVADLGESSEILPPNPESVPAFGSLPANVRDQYQGAIREYLRRGANLANYLAHRAIFSDLSFRMTSRSGRSAD